MKKLLCLAVLLIVLTAFVACTKKGEKFIEPPTEVVTLENGETAVYEVITQKNGEAVTEENGEKKFIPYDPPVTDKGGYIVTDRDGSTQRLSQTKPSSVSVENEFIDIGSEADTTAAVNGTTSNASGTTAKDNQTTTAPQRTDSDVTAPSAANKPTTPSVTNKPTNPSSTENAEGNDGMTYKMNGTLTKAQAEKLCTILEFENEFDADLCDSNYTAAKDSLVTYIADIDKAIGQIKADNALYAYVGDEVLKAWKDNIIEAQERYSVFLSVAEHQEEGKKDRNYYTTYTEFQDAYRSSLDAYYSMYIAAQKLSLQAG